MFVPEGNKFFVLKGNLIDMCTFRVVERVLEEGVVATATAGSSGPSKGEVGNKGKSGYGEDVKTGLQG